MLTVTITGPSPRDVSLQIFEAQHYADLIELRADLYEVRGISSCKPLLLTGLKGLDEVKVDFVDLPYTTSSRDFASFVSKHPDIQWICSYHNFDETPEDLDAILEAMRRRHQAHIYKIVTMARSTLDSLRMLIFVRKATEMGIKVVGHCMGEEGQVSRILGGLYGNVLTYACLDKPAAPGQIHARTMLETYRFREVKQTTKVYGLIGDPVVYSPGHVFHNKRFDEKTIDAIYVKMRVTSSELTRFFDYTQALGFSGLSVTMPLKEDVMKFCECNDLSCNTIKYTAGKLLGRNTDGVAVIEAIEQRTSLKDKKMLILGAGGSAKVIAAAAALSGAQIVIFNRDEERAKELASKVGGEAFTLDRFPEFAKQGYDMLINATSVGFGTNKGSPIPLDCLQPNAIVFDATSTSEETLLIRTAAEKGCTCITGQEMYQIQALRQHQFWFS